PPPALSTLSLHDALPIYRPRTRPISCDPRNRTENGALGGKPRNSPLLGGFRMEYMVMPARTITWAAPIRGGCGTPWTGTSCESSDREEHTSELQSRENLV